MADILKKNGRFRTLLRLNFLLAWRPPKIGGIGNLIGTLLFFGVFLILGILFFGIGLALSINLHFLPKQVQLLTWGGAILLVFFILLSIFGNDLSPGNDPTPLFQTPLRPSQLILAELIARIAGPPVILPLGFFTGSILGIAITGHYLTAILASLGMIIWIFQAFLLLTTADYLLFDLRSSRYFTRFIWLISAFFIGLWLLLQFWIYSGREIGHSYFKAIFLKLQVIWPSIEHTAFFFPGLSPMAWVTGNGQSLFFLLAAAVEIFLILKLGGHSLRRLMENGTATTYKKKKTKPLKKKRKKSIGSKLPFWPFAAKETHYLARDPQLKMLLLNVFAGPLSLLVIFSTPKSGFSLRAVEYGVPFLFLMYMGPFIFNSLAIERDGLMVSLLSPFPRWKLFAGKNFVYLVFYLLLLVPVSAILAFKGIPPFALAADWACFLPLALIFFGAGNLVSIYMPIPLIASGKRLRPDPQRGRQWFFILIRLVINGVLFAVAAPLFIGRFALLHFQHQLWVVLPVILVMLAYGAAAYYFLLRAVNRQLPLKEPGIFEIIVRKVN